MKTELRYIKSKPTKSVGLQTDIKKQIKKKTAAAVGAAPDISIRADSGTGQSFFLIDTSSPVKSSRNTIGGLHTGRATTRPDVLDDDDFKRQLQIDWRNQVVQERKLAQNSSASVFEFAHPTPRSRDARVYRRKQKTCTNKDFKGFKTDLFNAKTPLNLSK